MADMRTSLQGGYADAYKDMIDPRKAGMTHTGQEPVGMDTVRAMYAMPGNIANWARNNPLDAGALAVSPVPIAGDIAGFANDMRHMIQNPEERTWGNAALAGAGLLPFMPPMAGMVRGVKGAGKMTDALTDLPMDEASMMARAQDMGFNLNNKYYHQTDKDINEFKLNAVPNSHSGGGAIWLRDDPSYSLSAHNTGKRGDMSEGVNEIDTFINDAKELTARKYSEMRRDGVLSSGFPQIISMEENKLLRNLGYTHVKSGAEVAVFDPKNIRSTRAKFDPAKRESANLLAGIAGASVVTPAMIEAFLADREGQY